MQAARHPELRLMDALLDLADDISSLDLVVDVDRLAFVVGPAHLPEGQENTSFHGLVCST